MAQYRFLADHSIGQFYYSAGTVASTSDVGGTLPANWKPSNAVEPLDGAALTAFYNAGPSLFGLLRSQFGFIAQPSTYWLAQPQASGPPKWSLTGLGQALTPIFF